jgi:hypothetical protein
MLPMSGSKNQMAMLYLNKNSSSISQKDLMVQLKKKHQSMIPTVPVHLSFLDADFNQATPRGKTKSLLHKSMLCISVQK